MKNYPVVFGVCPQTCNYYDGGHCRRHSGTCDVYHHPGLQGKKSLKELFSSDGDKEKCE